MPKKSVSKHTKVACSLLSTYAQVKTKATRAVISSAVKMPRYFPLYLLGLASFASPHHDRMISARYQSVNKKS